ncbi:hypothetical protein WN943_026017 [Citrus x changshan-huyou]
MGEVNERSIEVMNPNENEGGFIWACFPKPKLDGEKEEDYGLTPISTLLIKDKSYCLSPLVSGILDPDNIFLLHFISKLFKGNDVSVWETVRGMKHWEIMSQNPRLSQRFNQAMVNDSEMATFIVKDCCRTLIERLGSMVDLFFHAFGGEDSLKILKKCREAIAGNGQREKVLIMDIVINEKEDEDQVTEASSCVTL